LIARVTHDSASGTQAIARSIEHLNAHIADLQMRVDQFRLAALEASDSEAGVQVESPAVRPNPIAV
jgi:hypothetical protein